MLKWQVWRARNNHRFLLKCKQQGIINFKDLPISQGAMPALEGLIHWHTRGRFHLSYTITIPRGFSWLSFQKEICTFHSCKNNKCSMYKSWKTWKGTKEKLNNKSQLRNWKGYSNKYVQNTQVIMDIHKTTARRSNSGKESSANSGN